MCWCVDGGWRQAFKGCCVTEMFTRFWICSCSHALMLEQQKARQNGKKREYENRHHLPTSSEKLLFRLCVVRQVSCISLRGNLSLTIDSAINSFNFDQNASKREKVKKVSTLFVASRRQFILFGFCACEAVSRTLGMRPCVLIYQMEYLINFIARITLRHCKHEINTLPES